jgi:ankyrin repeat protein
VAFCLVSHISYNLHDVVHRYDLLSSTCATIKQSGNTALMWASQGGRAEAVKLLIIAGADVHVLNKVCGTNTSLSLCVLVVMHLRVDSSYRMAGQHSCGHLRTAKEK